LLAPALALVHQRQLQFVVHFHTTSHIRYPILYVSWRAVLSRSDGTVTLGNFQQIT
jgi:hypothetical protein